MAYLEQRFWTLEPKRVLSQLSDLWQNFCFPICKMEMVTVSSSKFVVMCVHCLVLSTQEMLAAAMIIIIKQGGKEASYCTGGLLGNLKKA